MCRKKKLKRPSSTDQKDLKDGKGKKVKGDTSKDDDGVLPEEPPKDPAEIQLMQRYHDQIIIIIIIIIIVIINHNHNFN